MERIGVRELRQHASRWLAYVERGETIEVTNQGRPVAWLQPVPRGDVLERLEAEGALTRGRGDPLEIEPVTGRTDLEPPSQRLARAREHER